MHATTAQPLEADMAVYTWPKEAVRADFCKWDEADFAGAVAGRLTEHFGLVLWTDLWTRRHKLKIR